MMFHSRMLAGEACEAGDGGAAHGTVLGYQAPGAPVGLSPRFLLPVCCSFP